MRLRLLILLSCACVLASCGVRERLFGVAGVAADALPFRASLTRGEDRREFAVRVARAGGVPLDQARESARFPATRYCLNTFGGSDVDWDMSAQGADWAVTRDGDDLIVSGRCVTR